MLWGFNVYFAFGILQFMIVAVNTLQINYLTLKTVKRKKIMPLSIF